MDDPFVPDVGHVSDGELAFLSSRPSSPVHHHHNAVLITPQSLRDGWVSLVQCHENLDPVPRTEVVFRKGRIRHLKVLNYSNIGQVTIDGDSVQLTTVGRGASLCLSAETQALTNNGDGTYSLHNGPFMRRFLDGYYPMHVSMEVTYGGTGLQLAAARPQAQAGFDIRESKGNVELEAWFEGQLRTELQFLAP